MSFKCFVDGLNLANPQGTGIASYTRSLLRTIKSIGHETGIIYGRNVGNSSNPALREILFFRSETLPSPRKAILSDIKEIVRYKRLGEIRPHRIYLNIVDKSYSKNINNDAKYIYNYRNIFTISKKYYKIFHQFLKMSLEVSPKVVHWTHLIPIRISNCINIYTIHDLVPFTHPDTVGGNHLLNWSIIVDIVKSGDHILTVSEASKRDIIRLFNAPESQVTNLYQAVDFEEALKNRPKPLVERDVNGLFGLEYGHYFLFYGAIEPKKNVKRLVEAYMAADCPDYPLVIVSSRSWSAEEDHALLEQLKGRDLPGKKKIIQLDYMSRSQLVSAIKGARAVVFPSIAEGFGLPVAEAMCLGTAVISSTHPAIKEVAGDAALLVDPYDVDAISEAISTLAEDDDLVKTLQQRGPVQAEKFSMENYKKRLKDFYKKFGF